MTKTQNNLTITGKYATLSLREEKKMQRIEIDNEVLIELGKKAAEFGLVFQQNGPNLTLRRLLGIASPKQDKGESDGSNITGSKIEIPFRETNRTYGRILIPKENRHFFPGKRLPFTLVTEFGESEADIGGAPPGERGDQDAGSRLRGRLRKWIGAHPELKTGDLLIIKVLEPGKRYELTAKPK